MNYKEGSRNFIVHLSKESKDAFAYPQSVREINKLPTCYFKKSKSKKTKQLSNSHSGASHTLTATDWQTQTHKVTDTVSHTHTRAHTSFPLEIKSLRRRFFSLFFPSFLFLLKCSFPSLASIWKTNQANNLLGGVGAARWCLWRCISQQSSPSFSSECVCGLCFERTEET